MIYITILKKFTQYYDSAVILEYREFLMRQGLMFHERFCDRERRDWVGAIEEDTRESRQM
jgi:hypothetical protein